MHPSPLLPPELAARANAVASVIRERLDSPAGADAHAARAAGQSDLSFWNGASLSEGHAGLALLHLHAARTAERGAEGEWSRDRAFSFVRAAFAATQEEALTHPGLFDGTAGLAFVLREVAADEPRFLPSLAALDEQLSRQVLAMELPRRPGAVAAHHYDLVYGCAGVLAHLCHVRPTTPLVEQALQRCLRYLMWVGADQRWAVEGRLDTGMSHGAAGIAAALATAWRHGHRLPGQRLVLDRLVAWLLEVGSRGGRQPGGRDPSPWTRTSTTETKPCPPGATGPGSGRRAAHRSRRDRRPGPGSTGVRRAGRAARPGRRRGRAAFAHRVPRPRRMRRARPRVRRAGQRGRRAGLARLVTELLDAAEPERALVYRDRETTGHVVDNPGLLTGAAGVALALRATATGRRPSWWRVLFLR
ncbi:hypothetical protein O1L44_22400 [Streptomyces noursei]|nr:hypothetical protein [Streptomyces noursei]